MKTLAYLDPGTGSMLLQALVGGFAGTLVFARYVWRTVFLRRKDSHESSNDNSAEEPPEAVPHH